MSGNSCHHITQTHREEQGQVKTLGNTSWQREPGFGLWFPHQEDRQAVIRAASSPTTSEQIIRHRPFRNLNTSHHASCSLCPQTTLTINLRSLTPVLSTCSCCLLLLAVTKWEFYCNMGKPAQQGSLFFERSLNFQWNVIPACLLSRITAVRFQGRTH